MASEDCVEISGVRIDRLTLRSLLARVEKFLLRGGRYGIMYVNVHCLNIAAKDAEYRRALDWADIVYCDGAGVVLGAKMLGQHLPERMTGADWIYELCELCSQRGFSLFFFGAKPGIAEKARDELMRKYRRLKIAGVHHGYFTEAENAEIIARINEKQPDILLVGLGTPLQEKWIYNNRDMLDVPVVWAAGALLDFASGTVKRAPGWMLSSGMEWLYRLLLEPGRMWKRYLVGNSIFMIRILRQAAGKYLRNQ